MIFFVTFVHDSEIKYFKEFKELLARRHFINRTFISVATVEGADHIRCIWRDDAHRLHGQLWINDFMNKVAVLQKTISGSTESYIYGLLWWENITATIFTEWYHKLRGRVYTEGTSLQHYHFSIYISHCKILLTVLFFGTSFLMAIEYIYPAVFSSFMSYESLFWDSFFRRITS